jgi:hypothetical protein
MKGNRQTNVTDLAKYNKTTSVVLNHGVWPMDLRTTTKNLTVRWLLVWFQNCNCHGQHGRGGVPFTQSNKEATRQQSTKIEL